MGDYSEYFGLMLKYAGIFSAAMFVLYVYFAVLLMVIAKKSNTTGGWMAWLPLINLYLMCKIGRRSGAWIIMLLLPVLNIIGLTVVWMSIAESREKSKLLAALILIPPFTFLIPIYLAFGQSTNPDAGVTGPAYARKCVYCAVPAEPGETFCGNCGKQLPAPAPVMRPRERASVGLMVVAGMAMLLFMTLASIGGTYFLFFRDVQYAEPAREMPKVPEFASGVMTEFPIDNDKANPLKPTDIVTQAFNTPGTNGEPPLDLLPKEWLPPGMGTDVLKQFAQAATTVVYAPKNSTLANTKPTTKAALPGFSPTRPPTNGNPTTVTRPGVQLPPIEFHTPPGSEQPTITIRNPDGTVSSTTPPPLEPSPPDDNVYVTTIQAQAGNGPDATAKLANGVAQASGGNISGVNVKMPDGNVLSGRSVKSTHICVYILNNPRTTTITICYAPSPEGFTGCTKLANNVGNSKGLLTPDETGIAPLTNLLGPFPAKPPEGLTIQEMNTYGDIFGDLMKQAPPEVRDATKNLPALFPPRVSLATYRDGARNEYNAMVGTYPTARNALNVWWTVRYGIGSATGGKSIDLLKDKAVYWDIEKTDRWLLYQKGKRILFIRVPQSIGIEALQKFGNTFQM